MRTIDVEVEVPRGAKPGDLFTVTVEIPKAEKKPRGVLAGIALADMTDEQLKRELINANSVHYKAVQRGAAQATIDANAARVEAAKAEKAKRAPAVVETAPELAGAMDAETATEL
jgi:acetamidase/formamidase